jgi:hypothetical protein
MRDGGCGRRKIYLLKAVYLLLRLESRVPPPPLGVCNESGAYDAELLVEFGDH